MGYSVYGKKLEKLGVESFRFFINAQNPITWTKYTGFDPEVGSSNPFNGGLDRGNYPITSTNSLGMIITF